ncbi:hypothetical protein B0J14DRAFT_707313 [Halenospora varia]|nr:hypothetical protein B0J14DRAFT_707313 [Halenospora varia]
MPKVYVLIAEFFALPDTDNEAIIESMTARLDGRMWVSKSRDSTVSLNIKHMHEDELPSYDELSRNDFPANLLAGYELLPESVTSKQLHSPLGDNSDGGIALAAFQLNFI